MLPMEVEDVGDKTFAAPAPLVDRTADPEKCMKKKGNR